MIENEEKLENGGGNSESFADLFEQTEVKEERFEPGKKVKASVVRVSGEWVFLDIGAKSEGYLAKSELEGKDGIISVKEGENIEVYFLSSKNNEYLFTTRVGGAVAVAHLEEAYANGIPIEGFVEKEIKGGFEVKISGSKRAFCPYSQMELRRIENAEDYIGQHFAFIIAEYGESGRNIVLSRKTLLLEEAREKKEELKETLKEGNLVRGTITSIRDFGAFIDIGGLEGLIPVSEIGWGRVEDIHSKIHVGQEVAVKVMKLDWEKDRFSFSLKDALPDPWDEVEIKYSVGSFHTGRVNRLVNFGAFVTLEEGIDGLIHISNMGKGRKINHPREVLSEGETIEVKIDSIDRVNKRISLSTAEAVKAQEQAVQTEAQEKEVIRKYTEKKTPAPMGTLGELLQSKLDKTK